MIFQLIKQFKLKRKEKLKKMAKSLVFEIRKVFKFENRKIRSTRERKNNCNSSSRTPFTNSFLFLSFFAVNENNDKILLLKSWIFLYQYATFNGDYWLLANAKIYFSQCWEVWNSTFSFLVYSVHANSFGDILQFDK